MAPKQATENASVAAALVPPTCFESSVAGINVHVETSNKQNRRQFPNTQDTNGETDEDSRNSVNVTCTNEAMEYLRHCHGQFVALLASDLVSGSDDKSQSKRSKRKRKKVSVDSPENEILTVTSTGVIDALERLEFRDIAMKLKRMSSNENNSEQAGLDGSMKHKTKNSIGGSRKTKSAKIKKNFNNAAMTADLMKEQERLFALSAAKVKEQNCPKR